MDEPLGVTQEVWVFLPQSQTPQRASFAREVLSNQLDRMTHPLEVSQPLSVAILVSPWTLARSAEGRLSYGISLETKTWGVGLLFSRL